MEIEFNSSKSVHTEIKKLFKQDEFEKASVLSRLEEGNLREGIILTNLHLYYYKFVEILEDKVNKTNYITETLNYKKYKAYIDIFDLSDVKYVRFSQKFQYLALCFFIKSKKTEVTVKFHIEQQSDIENFCQNISDIVVFESEKYPGVRLSYSFRNLLESNADTKTTTKTTSNLIQNVELEQQSIESKIIANKMKDKELNVSYNEQTATKNYNFNTTQNKISDIKDVLPNFQNTNNYNENNQSNNTNRLLNKGNETQEIINKDFQNQTKDISNTSFIHIKANINEKVNTHEKKDSKSNLEQESQQDQILKKQILGEKDKTNYNAHDTNLNRITNETKSLKEHEDNEKINEHKKTSKTENTYEKSIKTYQGNSNSKLCSTNFSSTPKQNERILDFNKSKDITAKSCVTYNEAATENETETGSLDYSTHLNFKTTNKNNTQSLIYGQNNINPDSKSVIDGPNWKDSLVGSILSLAIGFLWYKFFKGKN